MLRFIMRKKESFSGNTFDDIYTIDHDLAALESALTAGGYNRDTGEFERHELVGVEVKSA